MFEKAKRFAKKIATSKKAQMTCLMMVLGVTAMMAQTTAGDYSAGTAALTQVSEEIAKYVPIVVRAGCQEEDHDGCRCLYLPHCSCTGSAFVLWTLLNRRCHEEPRGTIS